MKKLTICLVVLMVVSGCAHIKVKQQSKDGVSTEASYTRIWKQEVKEASLTKDGVFTIKGQTSDADGLAEAIHEVLRKSAGALQ